MPTDHRPVSLTPTETPMQKSTIHLMLRIFGAVGSLLGFAFLLCFLASLSASARSGAGLLMLALVGSLAYILLPLGFRAWDIDSPRLVRKIMGVAMFSIYLVVHGISSALTDSKTPDLVTTTIVLLSVFILCALHYLICRFFIRALGLAHPVGAPKVR
jgi:hypothetical protein